jgi:hypothetical protein
MHYLSSISPLSPAATAALSAISYPVTIRKNADLQPYRAIYIVVKGALRVYYFKEDKDITESFEFENAIIARSKSIGVFRLWRDLGYAIGAILTGILADLVNINAAILFIGGLTLLSAGIIFVRMK